MTKARSSAAPTPHPARLLMRIRTLHTCLGLLIAPTVLFFAATGVLQIYSLHEPRPGYTPPALIEKLGAVHKDQRFSAERHGPPPGARPAAPASAPSTGNGASADHHHGDDHGGGAPRVLIATVLLKLLFTAVAIGLITSTCAGVWMALRQPQRRKTYLALLLIGLLLPTVLAALSA